MNITVTSTAFKAGSPIPQIHTGDGDDVSPSLAWSGIPAGAKELALVCDDPDAPTPQPWVHWVMYKIPPSATGLAGNRPRSAALNDPDGALQGRNSWGETGYRGPAPPRGHGVHHYHFRVYALDRTLDLKTGATKDVLLAAMKGHVLAQGELVGTYQR